MALLTREQILSGGKSAKRYVEVPVPEFGIRDGKVRVKLMSGTEREEFEQAVTDRKTLGDVRKGWRALMVAYTAVDENGKRLFTEAEVEALSLEAWTVLDRIADATAKLNKTSDAQIEELEKNSPPSR